MKLQETLLNVMFEYLEDIGDPMRLKAANYYLDNVRLKSHAYRDEIPNKVSFGLVHLWDKLSDEKGRYLELATAEGHSVWVDLEEINGIRFDAIVSTPTTTSEMRECLKCLEKEESYNIYLVKGKGYEVEFGIFKVKNQN